MKRLFATLLMAASAVAGYCDDWMARLNDNTFITQLSIPGTHDAATGNGFTEDAAGMGEAFARTQALTIQEQWAAGVRAFDLRPSWSETGGMLIRHGIIDTNMRMDEALGILCDSLEAHPTEFAIVLMRHEDDGESDDEKRQWSKQMRAIVTSDEITPYIAPFVRSATVGELRGHLLLLSRNEYAGSRGGIISGWSHSASLAEQRKASITPGQGTLKGTLYCQDYYDVSGDNASTTKTKAVSALLGLSTKQHTVRSNSFIWIINHTSGYTLTTWGISTSDGYRDNAARQNAAVYEYLADESNYGPTGIVLMDYAGIDRDGEYDVSGLALTRAIIENNFHYTPKGRASAGIGDARLDDAQGDGRVFDLSGREVTDSRVDNVRLQRGIYITGGRKVWVR